MTWYPDLGTTTMVDQGAHVRAVGWLAADRPFAVGVMSEAGRSRLRLFVEKSEDSVDALGWPIFLGVHRCELCHQFNAGGHFGVPLGDVLYVAPDMIIHYVEDHGYCPPQEFIDALTNSPEPDTDEYVVAVKPFRELHRRSLELQLQTRIERAAKWALEYGVTDQALQDAAEKIFRGVGPWVLQRIREVMRDAQPGRYA